MENMKIYDAGKSVPAEAQKTIKGGRLNGFTDINPMWRIRKLTELFGPCGIGWYYEIDREWLEGYEGTGEVAAFVRISLYIKADGEWSKPIVGVGGSMFAANESRGIRVSDECYKMAQTDAISVACKNLGIGAEVYWEAGETKYSRMQDAQKTAAPAQDPTKATPEQVAAIGQAYGKRIGELLEKNGIACLEDLPRAKADEIMNYLSQRRAS